QLEWHWEVPPELAAQRVQRGELEATGGDLPAAVVLQLQQSNVGDQLQQWDSFSLRWHELDVTQPPFDDIRVRQAFNYAYNKERLQRLLIKADGHFYPPGLLGYDPELTVYAYDPERARALLAEAGYETGLTVELPILAEDDARAQLLQQDLAEVGVTVTLKNDPQGVYDYGRAVRDVYRIWARGWGMGLPDPSEIVNSLAGTDAPSNYGGYGNPRIDELGREGQTVLDPGLRSEIYAEIERLLVEDAAFLFEGVALWGTLRRPELQNFVWEPVNYEHWDRYWLQP
ncbi:MAG: ABC transporter substrate-binding protein, partial [Thermomicrobiales bacterium]